MVSVYPRVRTSYRSLRRASFVAVLLILGAACVARGSRADSAQMTIPITTIQKGNFSGIVESIETAIRTPAEWENLWKRHVSIQSPPAPLPPVDFKQEM